MKKYFWHLATLFFVLLWFVVIPYLTTHPYVDLTLPTVDSMFP